MRRIQIKMGIIRHRILHRKVVNNNSWAKETSRTKSSKLHQQQEAKGRSKQIQSMSKSFRELHSHKEIRNLKLQQLLVRAAPNLIMESKVISL